MTTEESEIVKAQVHAHHNISVLWGRCRQESIPNAHNTAILRVMHKMCTRTYSDDSNHIGTYNIVSVDKLPYTIHDEALKQYLL